MANRRFYSKRKKRKALATHHLIRIIYRSIKFLLKLSNFKCRGPNKTPFAHVFAPFKEPRKGCSYQDFENRLRCLCGAKIIALHILKSAPRPRLLESFSLGELVVGGL
jgi:hypothetical protein